MNYPCKTVSLIAFVALLSAGPAFTQAATTEEISNAAAASAVALVYVQTTKGVNLYDAAANGKLTLVKGSPFQTVGEMIGSNGKYFITLGTNFVRSYAVEINGAIGKQVSAINTQDYDGADCGAGFGTNGAVLDHTGQNLYVMLRYGNPIDGNDCSAVQSFDIAKGSGALAFDGAVVDWNAKGWLAGLPTFTGTDKFVYQAEPGWGSIAWEGFLRGSNGTIAPWSFNVTSPSLPPANGAYVPELMTEDPTNHLAVAVAPNPDFAEFGNAQLASYTMDGVGNITSTNTAKDMPTPAGGVSDMNMSPSGKLLAVTTGAGLQVYHFNGAGPITPYSGVLKKDCCVALHWDNGNHLYALGMGSLFVYTVTPTSIAQVPGSPYVIPNNSEEFGLVVVPKL